MFLARHSRPLGASVTKSCLRLEIGGTVGNLDPAQVLIGLTGLTADCGPMLAAHRDGTRAEYSRMPCSVLNPVGGLDHVPVEQLAVIGKFAIPFGGLTRGRLAAGETLIVNGATGNFGSGGVVVGLALGASRVIAAGRQRSTLDELEACGGGRVVGVTLTGELERDRNALREAAGGGANVALDFVGGATDPSSTLATLTSLRRGGRMVLMGSLRAPLPLDYGQMLMNDWEILGNFMHRSSAVRMLLDMVRAGLLNLAQVRTQCFEFEELPQAIEAARTMRGLQATVVQCSRDT